MTHQPDGVTAILLNYNATTPVAPRVADACLPYLTEHFGTPSAATPTNTRAHRCHRSASLGRRARRRPHAST
jgi:cysteine desulfurase